MTEVLFLDTVSDCLFSLSSVIIHVFANPPAESFSAFSSRRRNREPGSAWLTAPRAAREIVMRAPLWPGGSPLEMTSRWPFPQFSLLTSLSSTARSLLVPLGLEMPPLWSKSSVSRPVTFDFLYGTNMTSLFTLPSVSDVEDLCLVLLPSLPLKVYSFNHICICVHAYFNF